MTKWYERLFENYAQAYARLECDTRYFTPSEMSWLLRSAGFKTVDIYGAKLGAFSRKDALTPDDFEILVVARR